LEQLVTLLQVAADYLSAGFLPPVLSEPLRRK